MPVAVLLVGILLLVTVYRGNTSDVFAQIQTDMVGASGQSGFMLWAAAIMALAVIGNVLNIPRTTKLFTILILVVYLIQQKGIFAQLETAVGNVKAAAPVSTTQVGQAVNASDQPAAASTAAPSAAPPSSAPAAPSWSSFFSAGQAIFNNVVNPGSGAATGAGK